MLHKIKMRVSPVISEKVQKICFNNGVFWNTNSKEVMYADKPYLLIDFSRLYFVDNEEAFINADEYEEVCPFAFIASNGHKKIL